MGWAMQLWPIDVAVWEPPCEVLTLPSSQVGVRITSEPLMVDWAGWWRKGEGDDESTWR